jgi:hypothetical protein
MQALAEARMPDGSDGGERTNPQFREWWQDAVEWISENSGPTKQDALFILFDQLSRGLVRAVDGFLEPLSPRLFPDRLLKELSWYEERAKQGPLTYARAYLPPDRQTLISWTDLLKLCPPKHPVSKVADETKAIDLLTDRLKSDSHLRRGQALEICRDQFPKLSERGFRSRIWPKAREAAGLKSRGRAGRKPKGNNQTP